MGSRPTPPQPRSPGRLAQADPSVLAPVPDFYSRSKKQPDVFLDLGPKAGPAPPGPHLSPPPHPRLPHGPGPVGRLDGGPSPDIWASCARHFLPSPAGLGQCRRAWVMGLAAVRRSGCGGPFGPVASRPARRRSPGGRRIALPRPAPRPGPPAPQRLSRPASVSQTCAASPSLGSLTGGRHLLSFW